MCNHIFNYPEDKPKNYNDDGLTLTGICRHCGAKQKSYGMKWAIQLHETVKHQDPYGEYVSLTTLRKYAKVD